MNPNAPLSEKMFEDCYYFLYSSCKRGPACVYRHSAEAKASTKLCSEWDRTKKCCLSCPMRHSYYHLQKKRENDTCYFEETPQGCTKPFCEYKHKDQSKDTWKESAVDVPVKEKSEPFVLEIENNKKNLDPILFDQRGNMINENFNKINDVQTMNTQVNQAIPEQKMSSNFIPKKRDLKEEDKSFFERLKYENNSILNEIQEIEREITQADMYLAQLRRRY